MRIQAVEAQVGITKRNFRFYEQAGLIRPRHNRENDCRENGDTDILTLTLKRIWLLRRMNIPLEAIRKL